MDISLAAPQVIAHRLTRMVFAGPNPSARDHKEFTGMVQEKQLAFAQAWWAASQAAWQGPWMASWSAWQSLCSGRTLTNPWAAWSLAQKAMAPSAQIWSAALTPIQRKAVSNARRLSHTPIFTPKRK